MNLYEKLRLRARRFPKGDAAKAAVNVRKALWWGDGAKPHIRATVAGFGGFETNTNAEVLNTEGKAIPGLCAAGECASGQFFDLDTRAPARC